MKALNLDYTRTDLKTGECVIPIGITDSWSKHTLKTLLFLKYLGWVCPLVPVFRIWLQLADLGVLEKEKKKERKIPKSLKTATLALQSQMKLAWVNYNLTLHRCKKRCGAGATEKKIALHGEKERTRQKWPFREMLLFSVGKEKTLLIYGNETHPQMKQSYTIQKLWFLWLTKLGFWTKPLDPSPCYCQPRILPSWFHGSWRMRCCYCLPSESGWGNWCLPGQDPRSLEGKENTMKGDVSRVPAAHACNWTIWPGEKTYLDSSILQEN